VGLFVEVIDIISRFHSLSKSRFQDTRIPQRPQKLLNQVLGAIRLKHYAYGTEEAYISWIERYTFPTKCATRARWAPPNEV
jgi:hypothetical protein